MFETLSKIFYIVGDRRKQFFIALFLFFVVTIIDQVGIGLLQPFVSLVTKQSESTNNFVIEQFVKLGITENKNIILIYGLSLILIFAIQFFLYFYSQWKITTFVSNSRAFLIRKLMHSYLFAPYTFHLSKNSASIITHVVNETTSYGIFLSSLLKIITSSIVLAAMFVLLFFVDANLLILIAIMILPPVLFSLYFGKQVKAWGREIVLATQRIIKLINHSIGGIKDTRVIGAEAYFDQLVSVEAFQLAKYTSRVTIWQEFPASSIRFSLIALIITVALISTFWPTQNQDSSAGILAVFAVASLRIIPSANFIINSYAIMKQTSFSIEAIYNDIKEIAAVIGAEHQRSWLANNEIQNKKMPREIMPLTNEIIIENLTYRYPNTTADSLRTVNLRVKKGESVAFIGKSGAGKTTLVDVILGLLSATSGDIRVDGQSIYQNLRAWQNNLGYITQSIFLTDESLRQNIAFGIPAAEIDDRRIQQAIIAAQLADLVEQLPEGLDTQVGERGVRLSGGQRQRVGIARALYHERDVLVLDEATSALDTETEKLVTEAIANLSGTKTLFIIAHRLSTVEKCDRLYLLDQGKIVKSGTFEEVVVSQEAEKYRGEEDKSLT